MPKPERTAAILVAAGRGLRAGAGGPKQYRTIGGQTVIFRAMEAFCRHPDVFAVQPVVNPDDAAVFNEAVNGLRHQPPTHGGATRQASVQQLPCLGQEQGYKYVVQAMPGGRRLRLVQRRSKVA